MKNAELMSHSEAFVRDPEDNYRPFLGEPYEVRSYGNEVVNSRARKVATRREYSPADNFRNVKVSDLYLDNIIAAGAVDMLKGEPMLSRNFHENVASIEAFADAPLPEFGNNNEVKNEE